MAKPEPRLSDAQFVRRTLIVIALFSLAAITWMLRNVLLMVFGAIIVATVFRALAGVLQRWLRLPQGAALLLAVLTVAAVVGTVTAVFGARIAAEARNLSEALPVAWASLETRLAGMGLGAQLEQLRATGPSSGLAANFGRFVMSLGGGIADALLIVVGGIFLAAQPRFYRAGAVKLVPEHRRALVAEAIEDSGNALKLWLKAQLLTMVIVGTLTGIGLWLIGLPSALALGLLAALLEFIPFAGPILAALPAVLLALAISPELALWTVGVYLLVQQIEGNVLQPLLQQWAVELPGAVLLFALIAFGTLFGVLGIVFAAPLTVVTYVLVKRLYVREALDTPTSVPGEKG